jgi:hypothetical protein
MSTRNDPATEIFLWLDLFKSVERDGITHYDINNLFEKGTHFMLAQVAQVLQIHETFSTRGKLIGRLSKSLLYLFTGNPDNEYRNYRRHTCARQGRRRLS